MLFKMPMQLRRPLLSDDSYQVSINGKLNRLKVLENDRDLMTTTHVVAELADVAPEHDAMLQYPATGVNADQMVLIGGQLTLTAQATLQLASVGESAAGGTVTIGGDGDYVLYAPPVDFVGIDQFSYTAVDPDGQTAEATVVVEVVASWQNVHHPPDVNGDRYVSPIDALIVIHQLNQNGSGVLEGYSGWSSLY